MKHLPVRTKFYWPRARGPVLIARTDLVINSFKKGPILDFKRYNIGSWLPQTNAYAPLSHSSVTDTLPEPSVHFHH